MCGSESDTIGGYNSFLLKERKNNPNSLVTTVLFDDNYEKLYDRVNISNVKKLTEKEYYVGGCTALYDALGNTIHSMETKDTDKVLFIIITDGYENASREYKKDDILTQLALRNRLEAILIALIRHQYSKQNPLKKSLVEKVKSYVLENYSSQIYLSDIAKLFSVSEGHLSRSFKKETSLCLSEYINLIRLEQAQSILNDDPNMSVAEIARFCGFNDSNYFSYMFKKHYGVPPSHVKNGKANI